MKYILLVKGSIDGGHDADTGIEKTVEFEAETVELAVEQAETVLAGIRRQYRDGDLNYLEGRLVQHVQMISLKFAKPAQLAVPAKEAVPEHFELS
jgi:hypothetical protein